MCNIRSYSTKFLLWTDNCNIYYYVVTYICTNNGNCCVLNCILFGLSCFSLSKIVFSTCNLPPGWRLLLAFNTVIKACVV